MKRLNRFICILLILSMVCAMFSSCGKKEEQYDRGFSFNYGNPSASYYSSNWTYGSNAGTVDTSVAKNARAKYTKIKGNGKDTVTILVYMCGTDLESNGGMASYDLQEMAAA
ncbi:MAG: peptidase C11, partial [Clostridia bacterium]|nr:peptidase C11 [Clostridia bacterium]